MAYFWVWMACFFTMAIFWKYMGSWSIRGNKDLLQVQREHCEKLCNDIVGLEKVLKAMEASSKKNVLNKNQCVHLLGKLILVMKGINEMMSTATQDLNLQSIFEELCYVKKKIEIVSKSCIEEVRWCHSAISQLENKETFRELLLDLKCCYNTARDLYLVHHPNQSNDILPIQFDATIHDQVLEDGQELKKKLELLVHGEVSQDYEIARHLMLRLRNLDRVYGGRLDDLEIPHDFRIPKLVARIGQGSYGDVFKSNWEGLTCATKVFKGDLEHIRKKVGILAGLSHPNLVQFFGCGIIDQIDENPQKDEFCEMHLVMELMDSSLSTFLKKAKSPLPYVVAIDIMHQIAKGVYYLHDMQVAHLDLKPDNVLYNSISMKDLGPCRIFKIIDYGTSQLEVCSNPKHPEPTPYTIGTYGYMAPEQCRDSRTPSYPFCADVWSFAMICSEILSRKVPFFGLSRKEIHDQISGTYGMANKSLRPNLPNNCEELTNLIQECWSQDPLHRPTFSNIFERLTNLKKSFLNGTYPCNLVPQYGSPYIIRDSNSTMDHILKVREPNAPPKDILVDLDHQLSKAKELLKMKYIGIVGMGGIGKTTLAKAIFDDAMVKSSYQISCFVAQCKNFQNSYKLLYEVLSKLTKDPIPKNFEDTQVMMMEVFSQKKVLLILDDIKDESQVHGVVPPNIIQASKGSTIIITTRQWSTIKSFVGIEGRLEVQLLNEKAATTLFTSHLCWDVASLSPDFLALFKYVVEGCNGLPLSLKVMGAFLRNKKRLRSWERALQRMARGKDLDGDKEIWNTMQISFDGLNGVEKEMLLDIACFFCRDVYPSGISKAMILFMWSKNGILPTDELERLIDMSLLKVNGDGDILEMHDHLRDMGRMLAKDTRIWRTSMISESGFSSKDVEALEGISLQGTTNHYMPLLKLDPSFDFRKLRVLILVSTLGSPEAHIANLDLLLQIASQSSQLEAIIIGNSQHLIELPHTLPANTATTLSMKILDLCRTCTSLKILDLIGLEFLKQLPNKFASSNALLKLNLSSCSNLVTLPKEVGNLSLLTILNLEDCSSLVALPMEIGNLSSLYALYLNFCSSLVALPNELGNLTSLTTLHLSFCLKLVTLPNEIGNLSSLTTLYLRGCSRLEVLSKEVGNLSSLIILDLSGCSSLKALPNEVGNLSSLTTLDLCFCSNLKALPNEVGNLSSLTCLDLRGCSSLVTLPKEIGSLSSLRGCSNLVTLPKEVEISSSLMTLSSKEYSSKVQDQTKSDDEHVLKKKQKGAMITKFKAKYDLSESFNDTIQNLLSKLVSLLLWVQIHTSMSNQQELFLEKGKVKSKDLITRRFLGQGCSGIFYETTWLKKRTIRLARKDFPGVTSDAFVMEAIRLFELKHHPNTMKTFCWSVDNRSCSLVMEYIENDLSSFMRKKKEALRKKDNQSMIGAYPSSFQLLEALDILMQIATGMEYIHQEGIYHGDLKPNNVFLDWKEGQMLVKVADFGLLETKRNSTLLSERALCFRMIEWSAPELFEDYFTSMREDLDFLWTTSLIELDPSSSSAPRFENDPKVMMEKADSYSFGLISIYVFGGEQMWSAEFSPQELRKQISRYGLRPELPSECPPTLKFLIRECWDSNPTRRPTFSVIRKKMQDIIKEQLEV